MRITCCICIDSIGEHDDTGDSDANSIRTRAHKQVCTIPCGHVFHHRCLRVWLRGRETKTCPRCRASCAEDQMVKLFLLDDSSPDLVNIESRMEQLSKQVAAIRVDMREQALASAAEHAQLKLQNLKQKQLLTAAEAECQKMKHRLLSMKATMATNKRYVAKSQPSEQRICIRVRSSRDGQYAMVRLDRQGHREIRTECDRLVELALQAERRQHERDRGNGPPEPESGTSSANGTQSTDETLSTTATAGDDVGRLSECSDNQDN